MNVSRTPGDGHADHGVRPARDAECRKVPDVVVVWYGQQQEVADTA